MKNVYENMDAVSTNKTYAELRQWRKERRSKRKNLSFRISQSPAKDSDWLKENRGQASITWIGHSTFLLQCGGLNLITDPVWAKWMGFVRRRTEPGLPVNRLPKIDAVLISHNHYDHLHVPTLARLPGKPPLFVPAGLGHWLHRKGFDRVLEFNWWEEETISGVSLTFVPAQHWSRRGLRDTNASHWGGWVIRSGGAGKTPWTVYFAGDSGYFRGFREIGRRFDIDVALMPIGAYEPEWFMSAQHVTPEEAVRAYADVRARAFIPMHYGAFRLADDTDREALDRLYSAWDAVKPSRADLLVPLLGETIKF